MKIEYSDVLFSKQISINYKQMITEKVKTSIEHNFYRIKPVQTSKDIPIFEMKVHLGRKNYRIAFSKKEQLIQVLYISATLQKHRFDKEVRKWLK